MANEIKRFTGEYDFLSNFYPCWIEMPDGLIYPSSEAAFQAYKTLDLAQRQEFCEIPPKDAKKLGRKLTLREDWTQIRDKVMFMVLLLKFTQNHDLRDRLIKTGNFPLIEGNNWGDRYWGVYNGMGQNQLGLTLMDVRDILREW